MQPCISRSPGCWHEARFPEQVQLKANFCDGDSKENLASTQPLACPCSHSRFLLIQGSRLLPFDVVGTSRTIPHPVHASSEQHVGRSLGSVRSAFDYDRNHAFTPAGFMSQAALAALAALLYFHLQLRVFVSSTTHSPTSLEQLAPGSHLTITGTIH